jgi:hypothetical protein
LTALVSFVGRAGMYAWAELERLRRKRERGMRR